MPVHLGSRTKVHLVSADLRSTTTDEPSNKKAPHITEHVADVERTLKNGHVLKESNIPLAGDSNPLHLLGGDDYMPFFFVRAGEDLRHVPATREARAFHPDPTRNAIYARILGPDPAAAIKIPQSLALRVELSKQSFLKTDKPADDIRIDVLFNGQLTHSTMWPRRFYQEERKAGHLSSIFSGLRFHWMLERAWVIVPPGQDPDGSRRRPVASSDTLEDRWEKIQKEVLKEASARNLDKNGNRPVVAKYLMEVAKLAMPEELKTWSEPRGQAFGIIDVVLSYGRGAKDTPAKTYLSEPTRMRSSKFKEKEKVKPVFEGIPIQPEVNAVRTTGRYNLRKDSPDVHVAGKGTAAMARIPARPKPGKKFSRVPLFEQSDTHSGPFVGKEGNTITSSEQLPPYLSDEVTKQGYGLQVWPTLHDSPAKTRSEKSMQSHEEPFKGKNQQFNFRSPRVIINRPRAVERLGEIPEEDEAISRDVFTSSGPGLQPLAAVKTSSSMPLGSSQDSDTSKAEIFPLSSSMPNMQSGSSSLPGPLLSPIKIETGIRARRAADQGEGGSPRKKRRLSGGFSPLDIQKAERGLGMTNRGVFTALGSPLDKSPRSLFNSFTLGSRIDLDPAGPRRRPPASPLTPDQDTDQKDDPIISRLVLKASKGKVIRTLNVNNPFRLSQLPTVAAAAEARTNRNRLAEGKPPFPRVVPPPPPPPPFFFPSTPQQQQPTSTQTVPNTPVPPRTQAARLLPSSAASSAYPASGGGIHNTPNPLPRYPQRTTITTQSSNSSPYFFTPSQLQTPTTTAAASHPDDDHHDHHLRSSSSEDDSSYAPPSTRATPDRRRRRPTIAATTTTSANRKVGGAVGAAPTPTTTTPTTMTGDAAGRKIRRGRRARDSSPPPPSTDDPAAVLPPSSYRPHAAMERLFRAFETPALARDCVVAYAQPSSTQAAAAAAAGVYPRRGGGQGRLISGGGGGGGGTGGTGGGWDEEWKEGEPRAFGGGVVRQVRSERTGEFEEEGVLVGVRFLVV